MSSPIRIGAVSYLNAKPLYYRLKEVARDIELVMDLPSRLADRLAAGELDVALIPSVEYLRGASRGYTIIPDIAIAARRAVRSVKLFCRTPIDRIDRLALDDGSRTSQALARIWLRDKHGVVPSTIEIHPMGVPVQESLADAILLIGDRAMKVPDDGFDCVIDMAEAWIGLTGLPFVFAVWAARPGVDLGDLPEVLARRRDDGIASAREIARAYGPRLGLGVDLCYQYLTVSLSYDLGEREIAGLSEFARRAATLGLAPEGANLVFHRGRDFAESR